MFHITTETIKSLKDIHEGGILSAVKPIFAGKPLGLWFAPGLAWIRRMNELRTWEIRAEKIDRGVFPFTQGIYEIALNKAEAPLVDPADDAGFDKLDGFSTHYVYRFPITGEMISYTLEEASPETKLFFLNNANADSIHHNYRAFYEASIHDSNKFRVDLMHHLSSTVMTLCYNKNNELKGQPYDERAVRDYTIIVEYLLKNGLLTSTMKKRHMDGYKDGKVVDLTNEKQLGNIITALKSHELDGTSPHTKLRILMYGQYWASEFEKRWAGIYFDESLFTPELMDIFPFLKDVEVASGCIFRPATLFGAEILPVAIIGLSSSRANAEERESRIVKGLQTVPSLALEERAEEFMRLHTWIMGIRGDALFLWKKPVASGGRRRKARKYTRRRNTRLSRMKSIS
jgi:hypothetical protein